MTACHSYDEQSLLVQTAGGNEMAFTALFYQYHRKLAGFVYKLSDSKQLTRDIVQEVFMRVWIYRDRLLEVKSFESYLFSIARNQTFTTLKKIAEEHTRMRTWKTSVEADTAREQEKDNADQAYLQLVEQAIAQLSPQQKKVYELSRVQRLKYEEIASQLNLSFETVKKHMHLALHSIRHYVLMHKDLVSLLIVLLVDDSIQ